jgi:hypothetical protein
MDSMDSGEKESEKDIYVYKETHIMPERKRDRLTDRGWQTHILYEGENRTKRKTDIQADAYRHISRQ